MRENKVQKCRIAWNTAFSEVESIATSITIGSSNDLLLLDVGTGSIVIEILVLGRRKFRNLNDSSELCSSSELSVAAKLENTGISSEILVEFSISPNSVEEPNLSVLESDAVLGKSRPREACYSLNMSVEDIGVE